MSPFYLFPNMIENRKTITVSKVVATVWRIVFLVFLKKRNGGDGEWEIKHSAVRSVSRHFLSVRAYCLPFSCLKRCSLWSRHCWSPRWDFYTFFNGEDLWGFMWFAHRGFSVRSCAVSIVWSEKSAANAADFSYSEISMICFCFRRANSL